MNKVTVSISKHNGQTGGYDLIRKETLEKGEAQELCDYLNDCTDVEEFYLYTIEGLNDQAVIKHTCMTDALGIIRANHRQRAKPSAEINIIEQ